MIISLRGPSGSGKSTLARAIFMQYGKHRPVMMDGRKKPYYMVHGRTNGTRDNHLVVPGHYEIGNGGVDTLKTLDEAYRIARWADARRWDVLMEGKGMSDGARHVLDLVSENIDVRVVHINIPVEQCIASVRQRGHSIAEATIIKTDRMVRANMQEFQLCKMKLQTFSGNREQCLAEVEKWLGLS